MFRKGLRRLIRKVLQGNKIKFLEKLALRLPYSRFHKIVGWLFWGEETIRWRGITIKLNPGEVHGYHTYFLGGYSEEMIGKLIELCRQSSLFVDVGANIGLISLSVACACPRLEVFAFEPEQNVAMRFRANLGLNQNLAHRVHFVEQAVAEINSDAFFHPSLDPSDIETGRLLFGQLQSAIDYLVPVVRLDTFFQNIGRYPDVVKIDVEGAELRVIQGMSGLFHKRFPKAMLIEVHQSYFSQDALTFKTKIKTILEQAGYSLFWLDRQTWDALPLPENWPGHLSILAIIKEKNETIN